MIGTITLNPSIDRHVIVPQLAKDDANRATDIFETRTDWNVDLSDCLSFALMEYLGVTRVFTYDSDFAKAGFEVVG